MAKNKSTPKNNYYVAHLVGGPKDGEEQHFSLQSPPPRVRFAWPEWCNYYLQKDGRYHYDMSIPWVSQLEDHGA